MARISHQDASRLGDINGTASAHGNESSTIHVTVAQRRPLNRFQAWIGLDRVKDNTLNSGTGKHIGNPLADTSFYQARIGY